jgi:putative ABC transport system substrate-binding protein
LAETLEMTTSRRVSTLLAGLLAFGVASASAVAQQTGKVYRIGYLILPKAESGSHIREAFSRRLRELGWVEGQNLIIDSLSAEGNVDRMPELAAELVRRKVDVIVTPGTSAALAAKKATSSIPIVMIFPVNPVELGLVGTLSHPGGNVTGTVSALGTEIFGKQLQLLKEAVPRASRVAILLNPTEPSARYRREVQVAARALGIRLQIVEARGPEQFESAFATMVRAKADALVLGGTATFLSHNARLAELATKARLPSMSNFREYVEAGGLIAYAVNMADFAGHASVYVDKILRGAKPGDLPVQQPTRFELIVNLKTAKELGINLPQALLQRADEVIQ